MGPGSAKLRQQRTHTCRPQYPSAEAAPIDRADFQLVYVRLTPDFHRRGLGAAVCTFGLQRLHRRACGAGRTSASMQIFLETERLVLRRFTEDDVESLVELDSDPEVMRFINGGRPTPRHEIEHDVLPMYLDYYERFAGYGFWAAVEKSSGDSSVGSTSDRRRRLPPTRSSSGIGCESRSGGRVTQARAPVRSSRKASPSSAFNASSHRRWS